MRRGCSSCTLPCRCMTRRVLTNEKQRWNPGGCGVSVMNQASSALAALQPSLQHLTVAHLHPLLFETVDSHHKSDAAVFW